MCDDLKSDDDRVAQKIYGIMALFAFLMSFFLAISFGMHEGRWSFALIKSVLAFLLLLAWFGLGKKYRWGKVLATLLAVLMLPVAFPITTLVGGYILYYLYRAPIQPKEL